MSDYSQGKIYKLYVPGLEEYCYIGSTVSALSQRLSHHRHQAKSSTQKKTSSCMMFEDNEPVIELIESYSCNSKKELEERERYWLTQYPDAINKNTPTQTWKERWEKNKQHHLAKHKEWLEKNKEQQKEYRTSRKDIEKEQQKARYDAGYKDKRNQAKKEKVECPECKKMMNKNSLWEHKKRVHQ